MLGFSLFDSQLGVDAAGPAHVRTGAMTRSRAFKGSTTARNINLTKLGQTKHAFMGELHESMLLVLLTFFFQSLSIQQTRNCLHNPSLVLA